MDKIELHPDFKEFLKLINSYKDRSVCSHEKNADQ